MFEQLQALSLKYTSYNQTTSQQTNKPTNQTKPTKPTDQTTERAGQLAKYLTMIPFTRFQSSPFSFVFFSSFGPQANKRISQYVWPGGVRAARFSYSVRSRGSQVACWLVFGPLFPFFWASRKASKNHDLFASLQKPPKTRHWSPRSAPGRFWEPFS